MPGPRAPALLPRLLVAATLGLLLLSGIRPFDRFTWTLEVLPVVLVLPLLVLLRKRLVFTPLVYALLFVHGAILMLGGHYTYANVPLGFWAQDLLDLARNPYDRLGHFAQGFVPALVFREILLRQNVVRRGAWLFGLTTCVALAISAAYELVEWAVAVATGEAAEAFLGTQGDVWDTQWDMFLALCGALLAQLLLARVQDRQIAREKAA